MMMTGNWLTGLYYNYSQHLVLQVNREQGSQHLQTATERQSTSTDGEVQTSSRRDLTELFEQYNPQFLEALLPLE